MLVVSNVSLVLFIHKVLVTRVTHLNIIYHHKRRASLYSLIGVAYAFFIIWIVVSDSALQNFCSYC